MANPLYGQNTADNAIDFALNASSGQLFSTVIVAGDNAQYGTAAAPMGKSHMNRTIVQGHTNGLDLWLPSIDASDAGLWLQIISGVTNGGASTVITAASGDLLVGNTIATKATDAVANSVYFAADASDDLIFTWDGTTTGGLIGSEVFIQANKDGYLYVKSVANGSGTAATPFS